MTSIYDGNLVITEENITQFKTLKNVTGYLYINAENASLLMLENVTGNLDIRAKNASLPMLKKTGYLYINAENANLPVLENVTRDIYIIAENANTPMLRNVTGYLYIDAENASLPTLENITGHLNIRAENASLPMLENVTGDLCINAENTSLPMLENVTRDIYINAENANLPMLKNVTGHLDIRAENTSLPVLENVTGHLYITAENASLPMLGNVTGHLDITAEGVSLPMLEKTGYSGVTGSINIRSLVGKHTIRGQDLEFEYIDGFTNIIDSRRTQGEFEIIKVRYFGGGNLADLRKCFIARRGELYAHGETIKDAVDDVNFKFLQIDFNASSLVDDIKTRQNVTINDYRLLTGACLNGVHQFLRSHCIDYENQESIPLEQVISLTANAFGGERIAELFKAEVG